MSHSKKGLSRRQFLAGLGAAGLTAAGVGLASQWGNLSLQAAPGDAKDPRFLIVLSAAGGASIVDSFLAVRESESQRSSTLNTFPDQQVQTFGEFRAVDTKMSDIGPIPAGFQANQSDFVKKYKDDMMVATVTGSSVTHQVGQRRSITGNEAWLGRTMQECVALQYGEGYTLPNVLLATGTSFIENGTDRSLPPHCLGELVANPAVWPLSLDGSKGVTSIDRELIQQMRVLRNDQLDAKSRFLQAFGNSPALQRWRSVRGTPQRALENQDLISKLMLYPDSERFPLKQYGLQPTPEVQKQVQRVREVFPNFEKDPFEAQAALGFLLLKFRLSVTVTIGPRFDLVTHGDGNLLDKLRGGGALPEGSIVNTPIAFDFSHNANRATQALMWHRLLKVADGLITLLKGEEYGGGQSFWDRSMIYFATDFGRSKKRPANASDFGTGHHLNNGVVILSPLANGGRVLGGVDPNTALTYGFNPQTGEPDKGAHMTEAHIYAGVLQALGVDTSGSGLPDMRAMRKA
ncbi:MAG: twin-arginine translocation signal domain-containing protein [Deltaproteobacteria bacterium]|nr:MAG: twin-arginine translocation signal domain-containing protein [Deltaproteobacteria bacterium]